MMIDVGVFFFSFFLLHKLKSVARNEVGPKNACLRVSVVR